MWIDWDLSRMSQHARQYKTLTTTKYMISNLTATWSLCWDGAVHYFVIWRCFRVFIFLSSPEVAPCLLRSKLPCNIYIYKHTGKSKVKHRRNKRLSVSIEGLCSIELLVSCVSVCLSVCPSIHPSACHPACLSVFIEEAANHARPTEFQYNNVCHKY